jgi:hypothetical protein
MLTSRANPGWWSTEDELIHIQESIEQGAFTMNAIDKTKKPVTIYKPFPHNLDILCQATVYITWDAGDVHLGYCYVEGKRVDVGWNSEGRTWGVLV